MISNTRVLVWRAKLLIYNSMTLELIKERNHILELIQENSIENSVQDYLSYILISMVHALLL